LSPPVHEGRFSLLGSLLGRSVDWLLLWCMNRYNVLRHSALDPACGCFDRLFNGARRLVSYEAEPVYEGTVRSKV
jgi:hypothetical protein